MKRALVFALALSLSAPALADEKLASTLFQRGAQAYKRGDFAEAAEAFEAAFEQSPRGATMYNAALAWHEAGDKPRAAEALDRAISAGDLVDPQLGDARERLSVLMRVLGRIRLEAPAGQVSLGRRRGATPPIVVYLRPGTHTAELAVDGETVQRTLTVSAGEDRTVRLTPRQQRSAPSEAAQPAETDSGIEADTSAQPSSQKTWAFVALGVGAAAAVGAVVLGAQGISARDEFDDSGHTDADARDRAISLRLWANVAWAVAIVGAGTGTFLLIDASSSEGPSATLGYSGQF